MTRFYYRHKKQIDRFCLLTAFFVFVYVFVAYLFQLVAPFVLAFLFALLIEPVIRFLNVRFKINRGISAIFCIVVSVLLIFILSANILASLWRDLQEISISLPQYIRDLNTGANELKIRFANYFEIFPEDFNSNFNTITTNLMSTLTSFVGGGVKDKSFDIVSGIPHFVLKFVVFVLSSFFIAKDREKIVALLSAQTSPLFKKYYHILKKELFNALGGYIKAQAIIMSVIATISITYLVAIKSPYALLMGFLIALIDALPVLGSGFVLWPWSLIMLISGEVTEAFLLIILYGINFFTRQFLEPKVLSVHIGLHPLVTLFSVYAGLQIFGPLGFLIGPVTVICMKVLYQMDRFVLTYDDK